jgi:hypothetical protein
MCITALKDLEKSSVEAIMELAFPSTRNPSSHPSYLQQSISRSRSLPSMSPASDHTKNSGRPFNRSSSGDYTAAGGAPVVDVSALARSEMYGDILDAEEEALGLSPGGVHVSLHHVLLHQSHLLCP